MANSRELAGELRRLIAPEPARARLPPATERAAIVAALGVGSPAAETTDAGVASPLTESARIYSETPLTITSSDGIFTFEYAPVTQLTMQDAEGRQIVFAYAAE